MSEPAAASESPSRYVVGIDLGTTNSALASVDVAVPVAHGASPAIVTFEVAQLTAPGTVEARSLLPSFVYLPRPGELPASALRLPWGEPEEVVGMLAARRAAELPDQVVASAKSWLCHPGVDRLAAILPWSGAASSAPAEGGEALRRLSPVDAQTEILAHLRDAWNFAHADEGDAGRLENQEIYLTVPASFDATARELTRVAAARAGIERIHLLEEPQAALYAWIDQTGERWRDELRLGDLVLVCDVGGGTTDLSLVLVEEEAGELVLRRLAVGDHLLLGGDNMDLALALHVRERLAKSGTRLDAWQLRALVLACREAKESLLAASPPESAPLVILGRGKKLVGGTIKVELAAREVEALIRDGFFPEVDSGARAGTERGAGLAEIGLPYASDPAITRHLASFVGAHAEAAASASAGRSESEPSGFPTVLLFNGGVMHADALRSRVSQVLAGWRAAAGEAPHRVLEGTDLAHAVARGAAVYGLARRGRGVRIRGGTARSYYVGIASAMPAVPGHAAPVKGVCVVPFGVEEGSRLEVPGAEFGLLVGKSATFRFFASSTRREDPIGTVLDEWETADLEELSPLSVELDGEPGARVPVRLSAHVTEIGTLELWFAPPGERERWRLEFNVRDSGGRA